MTRRDRMSATRVRRPDRRRTPRAATALCLSFACLATGVSAETIGSGYGWDPLEARIDQKVVDYMKANKVAGMTVAISRYGRLILSKGYGGKSSPDGADMTHDTRTRIGSMSKPLVTGPTGVELLARLGMDAATTRLYGPGGVFVSDLDDDQAYGVNRHSPIVAMAIGEDDTVYSWLLDGTYIAGASFDLRKIHGPRPYTLPEGKRPSDIVDVAINANGWLTAFYTDGTVSRTHRKDDFGGLLKNPRDFSENLKLSFPGDRTILNVVGIGQSKSDGRYYYWYDDKKVSAGSSLLDTASRPLYSYSLSESTPYRIRGMGISSADRAYTWLIDGTAQSGTSADLDKYKAPYPVASGSSGRRNPNVFNWYRAITLQHLLDHTAGFQRSGDAVGAAAMFGMTEDTVSYYKMHQYMLRTRPLRWAPGTVAYSNHGFGLWTIIIPRLSGKSYAATAMNDYLVNAVGLSPNDVRPQTKTPDSRDATPMYVDGGGTFRAYPHKDAGIGLAAGGWTASAEDMLRITEYQTSAYSWHEVDQMGWSRDGWGTKSRLHHNGKTGGGAAYVTMFRPGYVSHNGTDLGDIQIAVATNTETETGPLTDLAHDIVFDVPAADVAAWYDAWSLMN